MTDGTAVRIVLVRVSAVPGGKLVFEGERPKGYFQRLGISAVDVPDIERIARDYVAWDTGGVVAEIDDIVSADLSGEDRDLRITGDITKPGVWYASGRGFYGDDDDGDDDEL